MNGRLRCLGCGIGVVGFAALLCGAAVAQDAHESAPTVTTKPNSLQKIFGKSKNGSSAEPTGQPGDDLFEYAETLFRKQFFDLAGEKYERYNKTYPESPHAEASQYRLAECYLKQSFKEKAVRQYEAVIASFPKGAYTGNASYRLAGLAYNNEDYEAAAPYFKMAADNAKEQNLEGAARYHQARCLRKLGKDTEAIVILQALIVDAAVADEWKKNAKAELKSLSEQ